jgi:AraC-like DNA-binding protein
VKFPTRYHGAFAMLTVSTRMLRNLGLGLRLLGFDAPEVFRRADLTWEDVREDDDAHRLPVETLHRFWSAAVEVTGDPAIGVRIGAHARLEALGIMGLVASTSATLGDALLKTAQHLRLWNEAARLSLLVEADRAIVWYRSLAPQRRHYASGDAGLSRLLVVSRELTGTHLVPDEAHFAHPAPQDLARYRETFGSALRFDQSDFALIFPAEGLTLPLRSQASTLGASLTRHATDLLDTLPSSSALAQQVRRMLARELQGGNPLIENVATQLGMHTKTLTRRLRDEGTSHSELLEQLRREFAQRYLSVPDLNVAEVAFLLGYSDASAFHKAFRRWFGVAPLAFRHQIRSPER